MNDVDFEDLPINLVIYNVKTSKGATQFKCPIIGTGYIDIYMLLIPLLEKIFI